MRDGGVLGFNTHYSYTFDFQWADFLVNTKFAVDKMEVITKLQKCPIQQFVNKSLAAQQSDLRKIGITGTDMEKVLHVISDSSYQRLKGADYIIFNSARLLGLPVHIKPLLKLAPYGCNMNLALGNPEEFQFQLDFEYETETAENVASLFGKNVYEYRDKDITWCQEPQYNQPAGVAGCYGNEPVIDLWYKAAVILVGIPKWNKNRQQLVTLSVAEQDTGEPGPSVKIRDNVETCFKRYIYVPVDEDEYGIF